MKKRKLWIRRKNKAHVVEGRRGNKTILIWTISNDLTRLLDFLLKQSFFSMQKSEKIKQKLDSLDNQEIKIKKETETFAQ